MNLWQVIILGVVEGLTESFPVSSTAHLVLASHLLGLEQTEFMKTFQVAVQMGAMLSVVFVYWRSLLLKPALMKKVLAALVPTLVLGALLHKPSRAFLSSPDVSLWALLIGGVLLIVFDRFHREKASAVADIEKATYAQAVAVGLAQTVAIIPGVSRSGATILGGLMLGYNRAAIVEFSFLLGAPTIFAATALDLFKYGSAFAPSEWGLLAVGAGVSFVVALAAIHFFLRYVREHGFTVFGVYRILAAVAFWLFVK